MPYKNPPPCQICGSPSAANKMCDKHYRRWKKYGNPHATKRPPDWGQKHKHPLWHSWKWTGRTFNNRVARWDDFWAFVEDVGERPEGYRLRKRVDEMPIGPDNFFWSEPVLTDKPDTLSKNAAYQRAWAKKNPLKMKDRYLRKKHGIGIEDYTRMLERQSGKCAICGGVDDFFNLAVDHCHTAGNVRGLLCSQCNRGLGLFRDNPEWLRSAAQYLEDSKRLL